MLVLVLDQLDKSFTVLELSETKLLHQWSPLKSQINEFTIMIRLRYKKCSTHE
jgi:hypothetical protein